MISAAVLAAEPADHQSFLHATFLFTDARTGVSITERALAGAAFCGESLFLLAIIKTSKLSNVILHQFEGLHKFWDTPYKRLWKLLVDT